MSGNEMTDSVKEQLSACLDGELPEGELDLLLKRLGRDPQLRQAMGSFALVGEVMRAERPVTASAGFAARISAAIATEPQPASDRPQTAADRLPPRFSPVAMRWLKPAAGLAIAAGVAAIAVFSVQPNAPQPEQVAATPSAVTTSSGLADQPTDQSSYTVPTNTASTAFIPATRLTNYVVAHSEYSSPLGMRAVLSGVLADDDEQADAEAVQPAADSSAPQP